MGPWTLARGRVCSCRLATSVARHACHRCSAASSAATATPSNRAAGAADRIYRKLEIVERCNSFGLQSVFVPRAVCSGHFAPSADLNTLNALNPSHTVVSLFQPCVKQPDNATATHHRSLTATRIGPWLETLFVLNNAAHLRSRENATRRRFAEHHLTPCLLRIQESLKDNPKPQPAKRTRFAFRQVPDAVPVCPRAHRAGERSRKLQSSRTVCSLGLAVR